jgi:Transposase DDE domain
MCINDLLLETYCWVDDEIKGLELRSRGPDPTLTDSEVLTMELVGEGLGLDRDKALFEFFCRYHLAEFPALAHVHRTTFVRQAANLWWVALQLHRRLSRYLVGEEGFSLLDSVGLPVCQLARADRCRRFAGLAHIGREGKKSGFFHGFRLHLRTSPEGVIVQMGLASAQVSDLAMSQELLGEGQGLALGDRNYWSPQQRQALAEQGWQLEAPFRRSSQDPTPRRSRAMAAIRERIETSIGQLVERFHLKRIWARDLWHLSHRLIRKVLSHTLAVWLNVRSSIPPLELATAFGL